MKLHGRRFCVYRYHGGEFHRHNIKMGSRMRQLSTNRITRRNVFQFGAAILVFVLVIGTISAIATALSPAAKGAKRSDVTAVLFSYPWETIAEQCETNLGPAGYGFVQTSPPQEHIEGDPWWTYYQPVSYQLESRMGTAEQFQDMVDRCNAVGVGVIVDVVINHMTGQTGGVGFAGSVFEHYSYPGIYEDEDFHDCRKGILSYYVREDVQNCELVGLADLDTGSVKVQETLAEYLSTLVDIGVSGFRIDAAKHIAADEIEAILSLVDGREDLYIVQEVIGAQGEPITAEEYLSVGNVQEFNYGYMIKEAFTESRIDWLINDEGIGESWGYLPSEQAGVFVDNHDTERNGDTLSAADGRIYDLAQVFTLAWPYGMPAIQSGYVFSDRDQGPVLDEDGMVVAPAPGSNGWTFKHAQNEIRNMVGWRAQAGDSPVTDKWTSEDRKSLAFSRENQAFVVINNGEEPLTTQIPTSVADGVYYNLMRAEELAPGQWSGGTITVRNGAAQVNVGPQEAAALHVGARASRECVEQGAPAALTELSVEAKGSTASLQWSRAVGTCGVSQYVLTQTDTEGDTQTFETTGTALTLTDLPGGNTLTYTVQAENYAGELSEPSPEVSITSSAPEGEYFTTVYYRAPYGWDHANLHYQAGSSEWTEAPGVAMEAVSECEAGDRWYRLSVSNRSGAPLTFVFNEAGITWDNNDDQNYSFVGEVVSVNDGKISAVNPCGDELPPRPELDNDSGYHQAAGSVILPRTGLVRAAEFLAPVVVLVIAAAGAAYLAIRARRR